MKILNNKIQIDSEIFDQINDHRCPRQLYRLNDNDQYVLALFDGRERMFIFQSEVMTELLNDLGGGVRDVTLVEFKEPEFGTSSECGFEIRLYLDSDDVIGITQNDDVRFYLSSEYKDYITDLSVSPVTELWDFPSDFPLDFLEMSQGLKKLLAPYISKADPVEVISQMWRDYDRLKRSRNSEENEGDVTFVQGEFVNFTVVESSDNRIYMQHVY